MGQKEDNEAFWDDRYKNEEYVYGITPNEYLKEKIKDFKPGNALFPAEGEGRNAVYAATQGWHVKAFDQSMEGQKKAMAIAARHGVNIEYQVGEYQSLNFEFESFDLIALIYAHFPANDKIDYLRSIEKYLKKGGIILFEAFSKSHIHYQKLNNKVGGPKDIDMLFSLEEIKMVFKNYEVMELAEAEVELSEGKFHEGKGMVIRFCGKKI